MNKEWSELNKLTKRQNELYHRCAVNAGLTDAKFWILYALCESGGTLCQNTICEDWCYSKQTVGTAVSCLQCEGILRMEFAEGSRKQKNLYLTLKGEAFCDRYIRPVLNAECRAVSQLPQNQRRIFLDSQKQIIEALESELLPVGKADG